MCIYFYSVAFTTSLTYLQLHYLMWRRKLIWHNGLLQYSSSSCEGGGNYCSGASYTLHTDSVCCTIHRCRGQEGITHISTVNKHTDQSRIMNGGYCVIIFSSCTCTCAEGKEIQHNDWAVYRSMFSLNTVKDHSNKVFDGFLVNRNIMCIFSLELSLVQVTATDWRPVAFPETHCSHEEAAQRGPWDVGA